MDTEIITAKTAREALERIRRQLGPEAKVLRVRRVARKGLSGLFGGAQVEVLVQKPPAERPDATNHLALIREELARREPPPPAPAPAPPEVQPRFDIPAEAPRKPAPEMESSLAKALEGMGLLPLQQHRLIEQLERANASWRSEDLPAALGTIGRILEAGWRPARPLELLGQRHLFVGPAGVGKSALLGRRIVRQHLDEPETAVVAALDGPIANTCPMLQYQCEALGIGFEKAVPDSSQWRNASLYYDTPGIDWSDASAIEYWRARLDELGQPSVHLVLNAAYDVSLLIKQVRAFAPLGVVDVSFTHLDEETNPSKLWNVILGTGCLVRWLAGGQKIPGTLEEAEAISLLPPAMASNRRKTR